MQNRRQEPPQPQGPVSPLSPAVDIARAIRAGEVGCREMLEACLERVDRLNPQLNAIVVEDRDAARLRADDADAARAAGHRLPPLHGVPMTVKESFDVVGMPSTWGRTDLRDRIPERTAVAVQRLTDAGAIVLGKTNVPLLLSDWQTYNAVYGTTHNPWSPNRTPGGSSGGSAVAVACGFSAVELGSDIGASIRNPAHYNGVFGHKPSYGIVPLDGHLLPGVRSFPDISVAGPLARSAADLDLFLSLVAGPHGETARGWRLELPAPRRTALREFRVGLVLGSAACEVDEGYAAMIRDFAGRLRAAGAEVVEGARPAFDEHAYHETYIRLLRAVTTARQPVEMFHEALRRVGELSDQDRSYPAMNLRASVMHHRDWLEWHGRRELYRGIWADWFEDFDLLLCPCAASTAFPQDETGIRDHRTIEVNGHRVNYNDQLFWAGLASLCYLPATVAPIGCDAQGLPGGIQIIGRYLDDRTPIAFARAVERELGGFVPPPLAAAHA